MKRLALALAAIFVLAIACGGGGTPDQVVQRFIDGAKNADGNALVSCMSAEAVAELNESLDQLKESPEESAAFFVMMGVEITAEEIPGMTAGDFVSALLGSELMAEEMPDFSEAVIGEAIIEGDEAMVPVTFGDETEEIELILEDGAWKIDDSPF
ncbi:MAG: hypothetical protein GY852_04885 [bacterium]|nr:hypothetical protein [bacterium]